jgi:integrase/recombinase XerD
MAQQYGEGVMLPRLVEEYITVRQATGFKFEGPAALLRDFARFAHQRGDTHVRWHTATRWAEQARGPTARKRWLGLVRNLSVFLRAEDLRHERLPSRFFAPCTGRPMPYIYTPLEISSLLSYAGQLEPVGSFRPLMYVTFFGLLAATGLRVNEALQLRVRDFSGDALVIRQTKFRKTRSIPLHKTTAAALKRYLVKRASVFCHTDHFFISQLTGRSRSYTGVWLTFRSICLRAGIGVCSPSGRKPRIHDLRHTFAVRSLERCPSGRAAVERHMAALSTYLGHANARHTFWYLHSSPRLLRSISRACEQIAQARQS